MKLDSVTETEKPTLASTLGSNNTIEKNIPDNVVWIDDAFYVKKSMFGLFTSILKEPIGAHFLTGATEDGVIQMSRCNLKCLQDITLQNYTRVVKSETVSGNL